MHSQITGSPVIVIGAGPVGLTTALLLAQAGHQVTVYEAKGAIPLSDANSYPIGVNPRGQAALQRIDPALARRLRRDGELVRGWRIYAGRRVVAKLPSGTVLSTTRAFLNTMLLDKAEATPGITIITGHKLTYLDLATRQLQFEDASGASVQVDASAARVVAADGVWSAARRCMHEQMDDFVPQVGPWGVRFRVLFSQPGATAPGMDPSLHYVFGSSGMYSATLKHGLWCVSVTAVDGSAESSLLLSTDASPANTDALKAYVAAHAPLAAPLLSEQDYADFFLRDSFSGAVVRCPHLNAGEWLVLLGDAAHGVIPPTGEGVNSGMEDACLLADHLASASSTPFTDFSTQRMPDLTALGEYAWHLMENVRSTDPARRATNVAMRLIGAISAAVRRAGGGVEERLFGPDSSGAPYREIFAPWIAQRDRFFPPIYRVLSLVMPRRRHDRGPSQAT